LEHSESQAIRYAITAETERRRKADSVSKTAVSILAHQREKDELVGRIERWKEEEDYKSENKGERKRTHEHL
jgi:hypothetical protein